MCRSGVPWHKTQYITKLWEGTVGYDLQIQVNPLCLIIPKKKHNAEHFPMQVNIYLPFFRGIIKEKGDCGVEKKKGLSVALIIGIVVAVGLVAVLLVVGAIYLYDVTCRPAYKRRKDRISRVTKPLSGVSKTTRSSGGYSSHSSHTTGGKSTSKGYRSKGSSGSHSTGVVFISVNEDCDHDRGSSAWGGGDGGNYSSTGGGPGGDYSSGGGGTTTTTTTTTTTGGGDYSSGGGGGGDTSGGGGGGGDTGGGGGCGSSCGGGGCGSSCGGGGDD